MYGDAAISACGACPPPQDSHLVKCAVSVFVVKKKVQ
jgi:hypothetical protein